MRLPIARRLAPEVPTFPWKPFVVAAFAFTLTVGALTGAIDLWNLRVVLAPVPIDHHRGHAFAQVFGFLGLFTMGVSLQLAPRFFGSAPASLTRRRVMAWSGIAGVLCLVAGRLGALIPGAPVFSVSGAVLVLVAMSAWLGLIVRLWRSTGGVHDTLHRFLLAGVSWWWLSAAALLAWTVGQVAGGPLVFVPLESVYALALFGGTGSWLWGIFLRAGICTLHVKRPPEQAQLRLFVVWQAAAALAALAPWFGATWLSALQQLGAAFAVGFLWWTVRPFSGEGLGVEGSLAPRAVQAGLTFLAVFGLLSLWSGLFELGLWAPPLLRDATRHAYTLGGVTLLVLGFAGRMVPGFSGKTLKWPGAYDAGVLALIASASLRLCELFSMTRAGLALAGASGGLAFLGMTLVTVSLIGSMRWRLARPAERDAPSAQAA
ncbi:MAG: hypothetical protein Q8L48_18480 [Archangium sp.]|nr:hypothetical protein [Archangium sp.]